MCGDYRAIVNSTIENDNYPIARMEELFTKFAGAKFFILINLKVVYLQQSVDKKTSKI